MQKNHFKELTPLSPLEKIFTSADTESSPQYISTFIIIEGVPSWEIIKNKLENIIGENPILKRELKFIGSKPQWVSLPSKDYFEVVKMQSTKSDKALEVVFNKHVKTFATQGKICPIKLYGIELDNNTSVLLFCVHHSFLDGVGLANLMRNFYDKTAAKSKNTPFKQNHEHKKTPILDSIKRLAAAVITSKSPKENSTERKLSSTTIPIKNLKTLKKFYRTSMNTLLIAITLESLKLSKCSKSIKAISKALLIPINTRKNSNELYGNNISLARIAAPKIDNTFEEKIKFIDSQIKDYNFISQIKSFNLFTKILSILPNRMAAWLLKYASSATSMICTNVVMSLRPVSIDGMKVSKISGFPALLPSQPFSFCYGHYNGKIDIVLIRDPKLSSVANINQTFNEVVQRELKLIANN